MYGTVAEFPTQGHGSLYCRTTEDCDSTDSRSNDVGSNTGFDVSLVGRMRDERVGMSGVERLLVFALTGLHCALEISKIDRIVPAVEISPVPQAPEIVLGLVNVQGRILPVLNIRRLFRLPAIETAPADRMVIARTANRPVVMVVDDVLGVKEFSREDIVPPDQVYPGIEYLDGITGIGEGIIYIYDLDSFLSSEEDAEIEQLLAAGMPMPDAREA